MKNKSTFTFCTFLFVCLTSMLTIDVAYAQENGIFELNNNKTLSKVKIKKTTDRNEFYKLSQNLHATAYIYNNAVKKIYGKGEINKITFGDSKSFDLLNKNSYENAKLITITLKNSSDLNNILDLTTNKYLNKLKYVFIKCYFKCTEKQLEKFIVTDSNIRVFYTTETPS